MTGPAEQLGADEPGVIIGRVGRALRWSAAANVALRLGNLAIGVVLARLLSPEQFGLYAIALTVQGVVMTLADLGLSTDLVRNPDHARRAPTVASLGLVSGVVLAAATATAAPALATAMGGAGAAPAIAILALTFVIAGAGVAPYATLQRRLDQRSLFVTGAVDLVVSSAVTVGLLLTGIGVIALALGRVAGQGSATALQFVLARERPRFALDRALVRPVLAFGLPVAGANLLSWALLGADKVVLGHVVGAEQLGYYVLAFNISAWPMTLVGQALRSVVLPVFSRLAEAARTILPMAIGVVWWFAALCGVCLAGFALPVVVLVYGEKWAPAADILVPLAALGSLRVVCDLIAGYLYALGRSRAVLWTQVAWFVVLIPGLVLGARLDGSFGVGVTHAVVALVVVVPAYLAMLLRSHDDVPSILAALWPPLVAGVMAALAALWLDERLGGGVAGGITAGLVGGALYLATTVRWLLPRLRQLVGLMSTANGLKSPQPSPTGALV